MQTINTDSTQSQKTKIQRSSKFFATGEFIEHLLESSLTVNFDTKGNLIVLGKVSNNLSLSAEDYKSANLDQWTRNFLDFVSRITRCDSTFNPQTFTVHSGNCIINLPFNPNNDFAIVFTNLPNEINLLNSNESNASLKIASEYLRTISKIRLGKEIQGNFREPNKLEALKIKAVNFAVEKTNLVVTKVSDEAAIVFEDLKNTPFGKEAASIIKGIKDRADGKLLDVKSLAYRKVRGDVSYDSIFGQDNAVEEFKSITTILNKDISSTKKRRAITKFVVLTGGSGLGKTRIMDAFIQSTKSPAYELGAASLMSKYYGETEQMAYQLLCELEEQALSSPTGVVILKIDEGENKLKARGPDTHEVTARMLSIFLENITPESGIIILLATNLPQNLDRALISRVVKEIQFKPLSKENLAKALLYRINELSRTDGIELDSEISPSQISSKLTREDGRVIDRIIGRLLSLSILDGIEDTEDDSSPKTFKVTLEILKQAIDWAVKPIS